MNCNDIDLKAYLLDECPETEKRVATDHLRVCGGCRDELARLRLTETALFSLRDEEVPRRIAFVPDTAVEPRWWRRLWRSGPALGFASAALLSCAILVHAFTRPAPPAPVAGAGAARIERQIGDEVNRRLDVAVARAVAQSEEKQARQTVQLLDAAEKRFEMRRREDMLAAEANFNILSKQFARVYMASNRIGASR